MCALTASLCQQERDSHVAAYVRARVMCHVWIITCITIMHYERDVITVNCLVAKKGKKKRTENLRECNYEYVKSSEKAGKGGKQKSEEHTAVKAV